MIKSSIEKLAKEIGYDIGMSSDETQSNLLNGFCDALVNSMQEHNRQTQICYIVKKLNNNSKTVIKDLIAFIELKDDE